MNKRLKNIANKTIEGESSSVIGIRLGANDKGFILRIFKENKNNEIVLGKMGLTTGFGVFNANEFLKSLDSGIDVEFKDFYQYNNLILNIDRVLRKRVLKKERNSTNAVKGYL